MQFLATLPPLFSAAAGFFEEDFSLQLDAADADDTVLYGLGGATPSTPYTFPLSITGSTVVSAVSVAPDGTPSATVTSTYLSMADVLLPLDPAILADPDYGAAIDDTLRTMLSISLVTAAAPSTVEQAASFEWIDPAGPYIQVNCGLALSGTTSLGYPKNSLRLYFRSQYGPSRLEFDLFPEDQPGLPPSDEQDALSLRSGHDSPFWLGAQAQYTRNFWMDESLLAMGHPAPHGTFAHVYVNGSYVGLYHVRERFGAAMMAAYWGGGEDDYEAVNGGSLYDGSGAAWGQILGNASDFEQIQDWLDPAAFLDYMLLEFYAANAWDWWTWHNWAGAGPSEPGRGGYRWEASDADIALVYDATTDITWMGGPADLFATLLAEGHPDFMVALADAIHRNLEDFGPLTEAAAALRYSRISGIIEDAVVAESARWGGGWWDRAGEWVPERIRLMNEFFPARTAALLAQVQARGWYPLPAPEFSQSGGLVEPGTPIDVSSPWAGGAELWVSSDGSDPREPGGALHAGATGPAGAQSFVLEHGTVLKARLRAGTTWGPIEQAFYEVDEPSPLLLNEWNAVEEGKLLNDEEAGEGSDLALGRIPGNGGDWIELLAVEDVDLRGWSLRMADRAGPRGVLVFGEDPLLAQVRAGSLLTVAEDLPEDASYDPDGGDWRLHLRAEASDGGPGDALIVADGDWDVTAADWQLSIRDATGGIRFGPVGEGVMPLDGLGSREVGALQEESPDSGVRRSHPRYDDADRSSFGLPNVWGDGEQDLRALRGLPPPVEEGEDPELPTPEEGGGGDDDGDEGDSGADDRSPRRAAGCSAAGSAPGARDASRVGTPPEPAPSPAALSLLTSIIYVRASRRLRRRGPGLSRALPLLPALLTPLSACTPASGGDADDDASEPPSDDDSAGGGELPLDCWLDRDHDGAGDAATPWVCNEDGAPEAGDCDDWDPLVGPLVPETCDGEDQDCDGSVDEDPVDPLPFWPDADGDGYGASDDSAIVLACTLPPGAAAVGGDCDDTDSAIFPGAPEDCDLVDQDCDGQALDGLGASADCPLDSCLTALETNPEAISGTYWITIASGAVVPVACDMVSEGGGWTLGFLRNSASTGNQGEFGSGEWDVASLGQWPGDAGASGVPALGWLDLNAEVWQELQVAAYAWAGETYRSRLIPRDSLRIDFGDDGYFLYGEEGYYWCGGPASYTDAGIGAVNNPVGAPADCKGHGSLGSGWDFSESNSYNLGLTLCGGDGSFWMYGAWGTSLTYYGAAGAAQAIWVR